VTTACVAWETPVTDAIFVKPGWIFWSRWFPASGITAPLKLRDGYRVVVQVSDAVLTVAHGITLINQATRLYGTFFDGTSWQSLPYVDVLAVNNQIGLRVTATQIIVTKGAGAPPTIASGIVVFEFL